MTSHSQATHDTLNNVIENLDFEEIIQFLPHNLLSVLTCEEKSLLSSLSITNRKNFSQIIGDLHNTSINWLVGLGVTHRYKVFEYLAKSEQKSNSNACDKSFYDFSRLVYLDEDLQLDCLRGICLVTEKIHKDLISFARAELWQLVQYARAKPATIVWAHRLPEESAKIFYEYFQPYFWQSDSFIDVLAMLTSAEKKLMGRAELWGTWEMMYRDLQSNIAFQIALRECESAAELTDFRMLAEGALRERSAVLEFESKFDSKASADGAKLWFIERLKSYPVRKGLWDWTSQAFLEDIAARYGVNKINWC